MPDGEDDGDELPPVWNMQKQKNILLMLEILQVKNGDKRRRVM